MKRSAFPHAKPYTDRHGKLRWRYRPPKARGFSKELGADFGTDGFKQRYAEAEASFRAKRDEGAGAGRTVPGSVNDLVARYYRSPEWADLQELTKITYRGHIEAFLAAHADDLVKWFRTVHIAHFLGLKADTPAAANNMRKRLRQLFDYAIRQEFITANPVQNTKPYKVPPGGFHTWDEAEVERFYSVHPVGTMAHRAVTLILYTGAARVDAVKLGWPNIRQVNGVWRLSYRRQKRERQSDVMVDIPVHPALWDVIKTLPKDRPFLATAQGRSRTPDGLGNKMREWCDAADLPECMAHGLRKAIARRLAEAGVSAPGIIAVTGHKTIREVQPYIEAFNRANAADSAFDKLSAQSEAAENVVNLAVRFTGGAGNAMNRKDK